jgi:hypothetical protein
VPGAEEQLAGDLPVGVAHGDQPDNLDLAAGEAAVGHLDDRPPAEPPLGLFAEIGQAAGEPLHQRPGAQPAGRAVGGDQLLHGLLPPAEGRQGCRRPALRLGPVEGDVQALEQRQRPGRPSR